MVHGLPFAIAAPYWLRITDADWFVPLVTGELPFTFRLPGDPLTVTG